MRHDKKVRINFFLSLIWLASSTIISVSGCWAQTYPDKPIRMIVPFPPGGGNDVIARIVATKLSANLKQSVFVDNRAGANGIVGLTALMQSASDGYTLGIAAAGPMAVNPSLYEKLPYNPVNDFEPITNMVIYPLLLVVNPKVPVYTVQDVLKISREKPGTLFYASPGSGNSGHLAGELFNSMAKVNTVHVPYKGQAPATADLLAGQVQMLYSSIPSVIEFIHEGRLRAIAIGSSKRLPSMPNVPTISESGVPGYEAYSWIGIVAPKGTPKPIIQRLNKEISSILKNKDLETELLNQGAIPVGDSPEHFQAYIKDEILKWGAVVRSANIKAE